MLSVHRMNIFIILFVMFISTVLGGFWNCFSFLFFIVHFLMTNVLNIQSQIAQCDLHTLTSLTSSPTALLLTQIDSATLASWPFIDHFRYVSNSRTLHLLSSLPGMFLPENFHGSFFHFLQVLFSYCLLTENLILFKIATLLL